MLCNFTSRIKFFDYSNFAETQKSLRNERGEWGEEAMALKHSRQKKNHRSLLYLGRAVNFNWCIECAHHYQDLRARVWRVIKKKTNQIPAHSGRTAPKTSAEAWKARVRENKFNLCSLAVVRPMYDDLYANEIRNYLFCYSKYIIIVIKLQHSIHLSTNSQFELQMEHATGRWHSKNAKCLFNIVK